MQYGPIMMDLQGTTLTSEERDLIKHPAVGGVLFFERNYTNKAELKKLVADLRDAAGRPLLLAVDHEGGRMWRFQEGFTQLNAASEYGSMFDKNPKAAVELTERCAWIMASELLEVGLDLSFAPVLDIHRGLSSVIGDRAFHRDPRTIVTLARAFIAGMRRAGMAATGKHFPGHGGTPTDSHLSVAIDPRSLETIMTEDILPFEALSQELQAIMPAYVVFPEVDTVPAGFSSIWLQDILRNKLRFEGAIISDCLSMKAAAIGGDFVLRSRMALQAGCDMVILAGQERSTLLWVLENLNRTLSKASVVRLAALTGKLQSACGAENARELIS